MAGIGRAGRFSFDTRKRTCCRGVCAAFITWTLAVALDSGRTNAHGLEARYYQPIPWTKAHFTRVIGLGYSELGIELDRSQSEIVTVEGRSCVLANVVSFDVDDRYAFDSMSPSI
jgi:hypothetical protein